MTVSQQSSRSGPGTENNDEDFTRPENLIQTGFVYQTAPGSGTLPGTMRTVTTGTMVLRSDLKFDVAPQWAVAFRGDPPISAKNPITSDNPTGEFAEGLGDADVQAALIRTINARWAAGTGMRIITPTGAPDITSGKWQAMPIIGARAMLPELSEGSFFTALLRYDLRFAGDPAKKNITFGLQRAAGPYRWALTGLMHRSKIRGVMRRVQRAYRFRCGAFRSRLVWLAVPQHRFPTPGVWSLHPHRRLS